MKVYSYRNVIMRQAWFTYNHLHNIWDNLVFMWNSALREKFNFCFLRDIYQYWHFHFGRRAEHQAIILWNFETFLRSFIINRSPCSEAAQIYQFLSLLITLRFTCGERKICSNIKKSQNIMNMIVGSDIPDIDRPDIKGRGHYYIWELL